MFISQEMEYNVKELKIRIDSNQQTDERDRFATKP